MYASTPSTRGANMLHLPGRQVLTVIDYRAWVYTLRDISCHMDPEIHIDYAKPRFPRCWLLHNDIEREADKISICSYWNKLFPDKSLLSSSSYANNPSCVWISMVDPLCHSIALFARPEIYFILAGITENNFD